MKHGPFPIFRLYGLHFWDRISFLNNLTMFFFFPPLKVIVILLLFSFVFGIEISGYCRIQEVSIRFLFSYVFERYYYYLVFLSALRHPKNLYSSCLTDINATFEILIACAASERRVQFTWNCNMHDY